MKNRIYAISLLLSFLIVLSHQVISHHHHETVAYDFTASLEKADEHKHEHNDEHHHHHDSHEEDNKQKDSDKEHNHPFPLHHHVSATDDFDCTRTNIQESYSNYQSITILVSLCLFHKQNIEPPKLSKLSFEEPPFLIKSLFEPGALALRGPPSIA